MNDLKRDLLTTSHWGAYRIDREGGRVTGLRAFEEDSDPSPIGQGIVDVLDAPTRISQPMIRKSWLEGGPGTAGDQRGKEAFVPVSWAEASRLVAGELDRVRHEHGNQAIYAGSYGWASAGRFHHAQSQMKRFLNCIGGFTRSVNTYSYAAAEVIVPHVLGSFFDHPARTTSWESIAENCELFVAFGGVPLKNGQISQGGLGNHVQKAGVLKAHENGVAFVNISPLRSDIMEDADAEWLTARPSTDAALMLGLAGVLLEEGLHDAGFLDRYTVGFKQLADYLRGKEDGIVKNADWAAGICDLPADKIRELARRMAAKRTMISVSWSLTRQDHGEQPYWASIALASMLGQMGQPGTGIGFGYSAMNYLGATRREVDYAALPQGQNGVIDFIPVARVTDMLENPGAAYDYNGQRRTYPDIKLVWWSGGNPFHHHQDLNRMRRAWAGPDTIIANEWCWNALAKHADIVLPCTTTMERSDIALTSRDPYQMVMDQVMEPVGQARDDHDIFRGIAAEMGVEEAFTENRNPEEWQRWIYDVSRQQAARSGVEMPSWDTFQRDGWFRVPPPEKPTVMMDEFYADPEAHPLKTPSGKIELFSDRIAGFAYDDCPGHPAWMEPREWLGAAPEGALHMISNQPRTKLHSQLDHGSVSRADRIQGREPLLMNPEDAKARGLSDGQILRVYNARGACLAGLRISDEIMPGVIQISTGAWYDPDGDTCRHGNPNAVTLDKGTSRLAQGPTAHSCLVMVEAFNGPLPETQAHNPPEILPARR
ncbi:molybdopterin guanine dinucleotide-containing S/N-oxide reductase [Heliomarina baculiformis]|uniref:molybdopterin guanine dinucleotide-containing S/N-oxide reductase n=1 Tax=Heliomarina baculiformis TaxID=2872036 RepID=UPI001EE2015E